MDDKEIIALYQNRDERALDKTAEKYDSYCYAIAMGILGNTQDAQECVNDALLAVWESIPPNNPQKLNLYLGRITKNLSVNRLREINAKKRGKDYIRVCIDELADTVPDARDMTCAVESGELREAIERFLIAQKVMNRRLFISRYYYYESTAEMAVRFGISENQVRVRLSRIREKLRNYLRKEGFVDA